MIEQTNLVGSFTLPGKSMTAWATAPCNWLARASGGLPGM
jgi:hypothetical protein